jgi:ubiquitin-protein ligase E3 A
MEIILICANEKSFSRLIRTLGSVFSSREGLALSFQKQPATTIDVMLEKAPGDLRNLKKEDLRAMEGDLDKDEDCLASKEVVVEPSFTSVDLPSLRRTMKRLYDVNSMVGRVGILPVASCVNLFIYLPQAQP